MFSSGNTNTIAKINESNVSTEEFIDYLNNSGIPQKTIRENLNNNIIEELLSGLVSTKILDLEIREYDLIISKETLLKVIKKNKNFLDDQGNFRRLKYEKFLLEYNQSAPQFELRLKNRELQKNLFSFVGAGTISPKFLVKKLYEEENKKLEIDFINLDKFYKKKGDFTDNDLKKFLEENKENLKVDYLDFEYSIINPKNLICVDEFNQSFFDKIDQIEIDISNEVPFNSIVSNLNLKPTKVKDFLFSTDKNEVEKKIFELKGTDFDIFELGDDYVLYKIQKNESREPDITNSQTKEEILDLIFQKNKFDYNTKLIEKIKNKKFNINAVKILYSLPINSFTLINDEKENIYLAKVKDYQVELIDNNNEIIDYTNKQNSNLKNNMLKSYDLYLNSRYNVTLNQKTIERVKNFFQ